MKVVYILGSTRSGSTMLDLMISSHRGCFSVGELCLDHKRTCGFCGAPCKYWGQYRLYKKCMPPYEAAFKAFKGDVLVDSSKKWKWLKERAKEEPFEYKVIHLVRNGLDRLRFRKRQDGYIKPLTIQSWANTHYKCEKLRKRFNGILVKYEDICHTMRDICNFIGMPYSPDALRFWEHEHHGLLGSKTAYSLVREYNGRRGDYKDYVVKQGFSFVPRTGHEFLDEKDLKVFKKYGGEKLNKKLGYK